MPVSKTYISGNFVNGKLNVDFNQRLDWFIKSDYYTARIPLSFMFFNDATLVEVEDIINDPSCIGFDPNKHTNNHKLVLFYANESNLNYPSHLNDEEITKVKAVLDHFKIPLSNIILIANIYEHNSTFTKIGLELGLTQEQIILIDYYELQTYFFHQVLGCEHNKQYNDQAKKELRFLFGKVHKPVRIVTMYRLWVQGLLNNAVTGCLVDSADIENLSKFIAVEYKKIYNESIKINEISKMLETFKGSPDNVSHIYWKKHDGTISNHCPSYPYDHNILFNNSKVSLIPETYFNESTTFVTEKTYKTIYNHHPFTILSNPYFLEDLKKRGYKTFNSLCDESYDKCRVSSKRINLVIEATKQLINSSNHKELSSITNHNFNQLTENALTTVKHLNNFILNNFS